MKQKCINDQPGRLLRCHGGYLWEFTYGEMGPPGNRQNTGQRCPACNPGKLSGDKADLIILDDIEGDDVDIRP